MVNRASCGLLRAATLVPQTRHCPQSSQLSQCWQKPGLTTPSHHTDSPLSLSKDLRAWPEPGWSAGRWPGSRAEIKCQPGGWMVQERLQCQPNRSPGSRLSWATGPEQALGSQDRKQDTQRNMDEGCKASFPQSPGLWTACSQLSRALTGTNRLSFIHQQTCTEHLIYPRLFQSDVNRTGTDW